MGFTGLDVVHDTLVGRQHDDAELSGREDVVAELLEVLQLEVETGRDDAALVQTAVEVDDDLASALIIDDLELINVAVLLHETQELDNDLGDGSEDNLKQVSDIVLPIVLLSLCQLPRGREKNCHYIGPESRHGEYDDLISAYHGDSE